jgi:uncharacterized protein (DUF2336 family)
MSLVSSLIPELEDVVQRGTPERRADMLKRMTSLFLQGAPRYNEDHIRLFDDVFVRLIEEIEAKARAELSRRLAPLSNAPMQILRRLAHDDDIAVAGPVLAESPRLATDDLLPIARSKGQAHLFAISGREGLDETLTDILVNRGNTEVVRKVAANKSARLSPAGYSSVIERAGKDGVLAEAVVQRDDLPDPLFRELLTRATEVVQRRLLAAARPETQAEIRRVLAKVSGEIEAAAAPAPARDFAPALAKMRALHAGAKLTERDIAEAADGKHYEEMVAALSVLCSVPLDVIDKLMHGERPDPVLILCKSAGFAWTTARAIILARPGMHGKSSHSLEEAYANFDKLSASTAQRVVRFWQASQAPLARAG